MTTITTTRALLEQALESMCWAARVLNIDPEEAPNYHRNLEVIRAELAKPEQEESFIPDWANYRQGVADGKAGSPKWHDAPTVEGLWVCNEGDDNPYRWTTHSVKFPISPLLVGEDERWFGPIPQDKKGGAA